MCKNNAKRCTAIAVLAGGLALAGCGATKSDKAGGGRHQKPVVLTMANGNSESAELDPFAAEVARLSGQTLRIEFKNDWRKGSSSSEIGVIRDVKAGKADLAWAGSRAFDDVGVPVFDALHAPLLVDTYGLEQRVLQSPLVGNMLDGLKPLGVIGLGILPGPMRKPLGVSRLVRPEDYRGKTLAISRSHVAQETLRTLGARAKEIPAGGSFDALDGIEQQVASIDGNQYDKVGKYLTANVNLWPRPQVVFINQHTFAALSETQREALRAAAGNALPATTAIERNREKEAAANLCRRGLKFVTASGADLMSLRRALQPVYVRLQRDPQTKAAIKQIQTMRSGAPSAPEAPTCSQPSSTASAASKATPIDGVYRVHTTPKDLRAIGTPEGDINPENYGEYQLILNRGRFTHQQPRGDTAAGTYTVNGDTVTLNVTEATGGVAKDKPGEQFSFRWSLYRDQLTFKAVPGKISPEPFRAKSLRRIGDAR